MNILFLEDRGSVSHHFVQLLNSKGYTVFDAANISQAKTYWKNNNIDCVILDLNIGFAGLTPDEQKETKCWLHGWTYMKNYILKDNPKMIEKTIIFSQYIDDFKENIKSENYSLAGIIYKSDPESIEQIIEILGKIKKKYSFK